MQEYYFLFIIAIIWTVTATIQDIRKREVANWLNYSLAIFAFTYRIFLSIETKNITYIKYGIIGFAIFYALANLFYYSKIFAGGDAKLLIAYGLILPFENINSLIVQTILFLILLFGIGAIYSIAYTIPLAIKNRKRLKKELKKINKLTKTIAITFLVISMIIIPFRNIFPINISISLLLVIPALFIYTKIIDPLFKKKIKPAELTEGDWIEQDIKLKNYIVKKTVHGLSRRDIEIIKKYNKTIEIKEGVPFIPAFLIALITALFLIISQHLAFLFLA